MANVNVKLVALNNANQTFGQTDYVVFDAETADKQPLVVAVTHNALTRANINMSLLDSLMGSTVIVKDDTDVRTGEFTAGDSKVSRVINQEINPVTGRPYQIVLLNSANCSIVKSELYLAENKDFGSAVSAKVVIEKERERKLLAMQRRAERLRSALGIQPVAEKVAEPTEEEIAF
jgi:hypothetical protein